MRHLITVAEKLWWSGDELLFVLVLGDRVKERACVEHRRQLSGVEEVREFDATGMETVVVAVVVDWRDGVQRAFRDGENLAYRAVVAVPGKARNDEVIAVISTAHENAHHRLIVGKRTTGLRKRGVDEAEVAEGIAHADGADCGTGGLADKVTAGAQQELTVVLFALSRTHIRYFWMVNSDEMAMKCRMARSRSRRSLSDGVVPYGR